MKINEIFGFATYRPKTQTKKVIKKRPPEQDSIADKIKQRRALANKIGMDKAFKNNALNKEEAPPGREHQVKSLKKKFGKSGAYAIAWSQHNRHGKPDKKK